MKFKPSIIPGLTWLIISTILLVLPGSSFPKEDWLSRIWFDKWVHIAMFALLVFLWCWGTSNNRDRTRLKRAFLLIACAALCYGVGMEFIQKYFIPNRSFDPGDIAADAVGCIVGLSISWRGYIKN